MSDLRIVALGLVEQPLALMEEIDESKAAISGSGRYGARPYEPSPETLNRVQTEADTWSEEKEAV